jgi:hypothetical protein
VWRHNDSGSSVLCLLGDRGFRVDLPPGLQVPLQQWHAKVILTGVLDRYTLRLRLPGLDDLPDPGQQPPGTGEAAVTQHPLPRPADRHRPAGPGRAVRAVPDLAARRGSRAAQRPGNRRADRLAGAHRRQAVREHQGPLRAAGRPGLRGPRALEQLALLLISTGELTAADLRRLPATTPPG